MNVNWKIKQKIKKILQNEQGMQIAAPGSRSGFALVYPNTYRVGMSNLGLHVIYGQINRRDDTACERAFFPDRADVSLYTATSSSLMTIETQRPLAAFPLIGFILSFEMDYINALKILAWGKIPLRSDARAEADPLVIAGGPCATFNPEPVADYFDAFVIGEGEEVIHTLIDTVYACRNKRLNRRDTLLALANIEGVYVPRFYHPVYAADGTLEKISHDPGVPSTVRRRWIRDLDQYWAATEVVTKNTEFSGMFLIEISRGCGRHCRFCMAGYCFRNPRVRSLAAIRPMLDRAASYGLKAGLVGAAVSDHPEIDRICAAIAELGIGISVSSLRADSVSEPLLAALAASGHKTVTFAPEAGSEAARAVINKGISDEDIYRAVKSAVRAGIPNVRLYFMVGLPYQEAKKEAASIIALARNVKSVMQEAQIKSQSKGKLTLSINTFVPKPFTPFQWTAMSSLAAATETLKAISDAFRSDPGVEVLTESTRETYVQAVLARGDRRLAPVLGEAAVTSGPFKLADALRKRGMSAEYYTYRNRDRAELLPWQILDPGVAADYLWQEAEKAKAGKETLPCFPGCIRCGVCREPRQN